MTKQYQHSDVELRAIADLLEAMRTFDESMAASRSDSIQGSLEIWWMDRVMGRIERADPDDDESEWGYRPDCGSDTEPTE